MKTLLLSATIALLSTPVFAAPVCGIPAGVSVSAVNSDSATPDGQLKFSLSGKPFVVTPTYTTAGDGATDYTDPSVMAGWVALLSTAQINKATVCFDSSTLTLSLQ